MNKKLILSALSGCLLATMYSCYNDDETEYVYEESSSALVSGFSLKNDKNILDSLSNVFFTIDLVNAQIYNADSLPYGTRVDKLLPQIIYPSGARIVELQWPRHEMTDSIQNYLANPSDSVNFANGPVKLRIQSENGATERVYTIRVNVHQVKPDTLAWSMMQSAPLPTSFASIDAQYTAQLGDVFYCLSEQSGKYCLASTTDPSSGDWQVSELTLPFVARTSTLRASDDALYILAQDGTLYASTDGRAWTSTSQTWTHIYGGYGESVLGADADGLIASYPDGQTEEMPDGFPVSGTSLPAKYDTPMGTTQQLVMLGGRDKDGRVVDGAWSYDGTSWAFVTTKPLTEGLEDATLVAYDLFAVPIATWRPVQYPALVAFGGRNASGSLSRTVYVSADWGMTWKEAPELMQLPADVPTMYESPAFVHTTTLRTSRGDYWTDLAVRPLYPGCSWEIARASRYDQPLTEWECPAIYLFGGRIAGGTAINSLWRGCILRYTFVPKY